MNLEKATGAIQAAGGELATALKSNNDDMIMKATQELCTAVYERVAADYETIRGDQSALAARGYKILTSEETKFYTSLAKRIENPKASYSEALEGLPVTIYEDVFKNLTNEHPLLDAITFVNAGYATKWVLNSHSTQSATWGTVTSEIEQEITSSFKIIDLVTNKLSCLSYIPQDLARMGVTFIDQYVRTILGEAMAMALEMAIVSGTGSGQPIGMDKMLDSQSVVTDGVYASKTAVSVTSFMPEEYGKIIAENLVQADNGVYKSGKLDLTLICNPIDYYNVVMPATTVLNTNGQYVGNLFPVPTNVIPSAALDEGSAILCIAKDYTLAIAAGKEGSVEVSDEYKFAEDYRTFKSYMFANGRAYDNSSAVLLDISALEPAFISLKSETVA